MIKKLVLHPDRLFSSDENIRKVARALYQTVKDLPIISPHGHTDPSWFSQNQAFENATELLIKPDHYVFRMLYSHGISLEDLGISSQDTSNINNLTGSESAAIEQLIPQESYRIGNTTPVESQVDKWFASNPVGTGLDPNYMTTYNTAKAQIANTLGMVDTSNQFGYSSDPYGGLTAQNLATNPFNIPYMQERGLI